MKDSFESRQELPLEAADSSRMTFKVWIDSGTSRIVAMRGPEDGPLPTESGWSGDSWLACGVRAGPQGRPMHRAGSERSVYLCPALYKVNRMGLPLGQSRLRQVTDPIWNEGAWARPNHRFPTVTTWSP